jgi:MFS family permease
MKPAAPAPSPSPLPAGRLGQRAALWLLASISVTFLAASSAPSPLYALYRDAWGFSALTLTLVFASYAFALLAALLVFGALSDHRGRREVILFALGLEIGSFVLFWRADSVAALVGARALQGLATGIATSAFSAALIDIDRARGALVNSVAPMVGMAFGALGASVLVQFAPAPTRLVFELLFLVFVAQAVGAFFLPETVPRRDGAWRSLRPRIEIPLQARAAVWEVLPVNTAQWALAGFYLSLGPTLAKVITGVASPLVGGAAIASLVLSAAAAVLAVRDQSPRRVLLGGTAMLAVGLAITLAGVARLSGPAFFAGTVVAGAGFGAGFNGSLRSLVSLAAPQERGGLMSGFFTMSYLAFSLPAIAAGFAIGHFGLQATSLGFGAALILLTAVALLLMVRAGEPADRPARP